MSLKPPDSLGRVYNCTTERTVGNAAANSVKEKRLESQVRAACDMYEYVSGCNWSMACPVFQLNVLVDSLICSTDIEGRRGPKSLGMGDGC